MISVIVLVMICLGFLFVTIMAGKTEPSAKTMGVTEKIKKLLLVVPVIVAAIFAVLFCTVLKGRLIERSSHALIVLCLWLYGTAFYVNVLKFFKNKNILVLSIMWMIVSVTLAIFLTPLDRYCEVMFTSIHEFTYVLGGVMIALWYFVLVKNHGSQNRVYE